MSTSTSTTPARHIDVAQSNVARLYANLQPVLLLSLLPTCFTRLVADPVATLTTLAPIVAVIQAVYCVLCLPSPGHSQASATRGSQKRKSPKPTQDITARLVPAGFSFILTLALSTPVLYVIVILFGAPLVSHHAHTLLLALHLALLTTPQLFYAHGLEVSTWLRLVSLQQPMDEVYGMTLGACFGAWLGAIPIPLDWDREWQKWPVTIICGMYAGAIFGKVAGGYIFKGAKMAIN